MKFDNADALLRTMARFTRPDRRFYWGRHNHRFEDGDAAAVDRQFDELVATGFIEAADRGTHRFTPKAWETVGYPEGTWTAT